MYGCVVVVVVGVSGSRSDVKFQLHCFTAQKDPKGKTPRRK